MAQPLTIVVGAGAAGLLAAISAAEHGASVTVFEHNDKAGRKLYITGKGRCNVTNAAERDDFLAQVRRNPRFLYSAWDAFSNRDLMDMLEALGVPLVVERGGRVFPASNKASDVTRALEHRARALGVAFRFGAAVEGLIVREGRCLGVRVNGKAVAADAVVLATGGLSYPMTGSTGDGFRFAAEAGHTVRPGRPSLIPLETVETWPHDLSGLTLKNVTLTAKVGKRVVFEELGELLFCHFGVTGPLVLAASCEWADADPADIRLSIDLKPGLSREQLERRIDRDIDENARKRSIGALASLLPARLLPVVLAHAGIDPEGVASQLSRATRQRLVEALKALPLTGKALRPIAEAVVTRGGVAVGEIDPKTMRSRKVAGLYFAGELIDVDARTGGYNLQIAFSTGYVAGRAAAETAAGDAGQRTERRTEQRTDDRTERRTEQRTDDRAEQRTEQRTDDRAEQRTEQRTDDRAERRTEQRTDDRAKQRTEQRTDNRTKQRTDQRTDDRTTQRGRNADGPTR